MAYDSDENIGVLNCDLTTFFDAFKGQLQLLTGLVPLSKKLSLEAIRRPNLVIGDPGIGKTCGIVSIIEGLNQVLPPEKQLKMKKILLGQTVVGSLSGIPVINPATGDVVRVQAPDLPTVEKDGEYGVLFLDEVTTADEAQVQPALGLCDDTRNIGTYQLPEHWVVVASGNGPSCANFLELHDMTLSRFSAFDIRYDYAKDWRPWAHAHDIDELIIAFLNFKPEYIIRVVSSEADKSGKQFPCPRTWTRLDTELEMRRALGKPVGQNELLSFASRIIGADAAREFSAFAMYNKSIKVNPDDIMLGKAPMPTPDIKIEEFHIIIQQLIKRLNDLMERTLQDDGGFLMETYEGMANLIQWVLGMKDYLLDNTVEALAEINKEVPRACEILGDEENFDPICPEWVDFIQEYGTMILDPDIQLGM